MRKREKMQRWLKGVLFFLEKKQQQASKDAVLEVQIQIPLYIASSPVQTALCDRIELWRYLGIPTTETRVLTGIPDGYVAVEVLKLAGGKEEYRGIRQQQPRQSARIELVELTIDRLTL